MRRRKPTHLLLSKTKSFLLISFSGETAFPRTPSHYVRKIDICNR